MKTINIAPTWRGILPALVHLALNGETKDARDIAWQELYRIADIADAANEQMQKMNERTKETSE